MLKVIKCEAKNNSQRYFLGLEMEPASFDTDEKEITEKLSHILKKLEYNGNRVIVSLPRRYATCRYLRVPTLNPQETERIVALQASRYLPYPANELITGYQVISADKDGYSALNLVIVHKDAVGRYIKIFQALKIKDFSITLSSYGLCNLYSYLNNPTGPKAIMIIDADLPQVEVAIISQGKLLLSRAIKINQQEKDWQRLLVEEIKKTQDAYLKENRQAQDNHPGKIVIFGPTKSSVSFQEVLKKEGLAVEVLPYWEKISLSQGFLNSILNTDASPATLIGLGLKDVPESLNLLPDEIKAQVKKLTQRREGLSLALRIIGIVVVLGLAISRNLDNKAIYLKQLNLELKKVEKDARPLDDVEKRLKYMESQLQKKPSSLDILYELNQTMPSDVSLVSLSYEEEREVILRGQAHELTPVFEFVGRLEKSPVFKNFNTKVRYASKRATTSGEVIDFEIICLKESPKK